MADVIEFPIKTVRDWAIIESGMRTSLTQAGASAEMQNEIIDRMQEFYKKYNINFGISYELPAEYEGQREAIISSINQGLADFAKHLHDMMSRIMFDRLLLEIELYRLRHE